MIQGTLLPASTIYSSWFAALSTFVAFNTLMYLTLAALKTLPVVRPREWFPRRYERSETRSIYPDGVNPPARPVRPQRVPVPLEEPLRTDEPVGAPRA